MVHIQTVLSFFTSNSFGFDVTPVMTSPYHPRFDQALSTSFHETSPKQGPVYPHRSMSHPILNLTKWRTRMIVSVISPLLLDLLHTESRTELKCVKYHLVLQYTCTL